MKKRSENKGSEADLRLWFRICRLLLSHEAAQIPFIFQPELITEAKLMMPLSHKHIVRMIGETDFLTFKMQVNTNFGCLYAVHIILLNDTWSNVTLVEYNIWSKKLLN